jgi:hypothetical protein
MDMYYELLNTLHNAIHIVREMKDYRMINHEEFETLSREIGKAKQALYRLPDKETRFMKERIKTQNGYFNIPTKTQLRKNIKVFA